MTTTPAPRQSEPSIVQATSSPSARVYWLNLDQARQALQAAVEHLAAKHPEIEEVWLFGSLARGDAVPGSDADLLIVLSNTPHGFLDRPAVYQPESCGLGLDVFAYTRAEISQMQASGNRFVRQALAEGVCILARTQGIHQTETQP
jgi:predicted nucleotidyltransferase